ncbi:hypothetical protein [Fusobacterium pseudoperiodonticum]|uniref:hypothetical protein n=1 Tax=Fusobacterium pseudoperiodonticum TaxID=2663009 RepID=UPI000C1B4BB7|nr:hypothetical protein [Fusobacterium pseudoperiodonticum]ATV67189.1 hypothetical protein CTM92_00275 [Fusobacterium pseudoperiodonticum]PIM77869.1 hypothetical protein CTM69_08180 [Fusobacterium pseudoperiodonticum]
MSKAWRLHTKPKLSKKNKLEDKVTNELIRRKIVAIGWTLREDIYNELTNEDKIKVEENEKSIKDDFEKYKEIIEKNSYKTIKDDKRKFFYGKVNPNLIRLNNLKKDDLIWMRSKGIYYLGRVTEKSHYLYAYRDSKKDSDILKLGISNQFTDIEWHEIGTESEIPGRILIAFYQREALIEIDEKFVVDISQILYNKKDNYYKISNELENNKTNFYGLLSPNDCEDLLYFYLYHKFKYIVIPSTNKINTQNYEFVMLNSNNRDEKKYIQVKNGEVNIEINNYKNFRGEIYLLTTRGNVLKNGKILTKNNIDMNNGKILNLDNSFKGNIFIINPEALYEFAKEAYENESILMPHSILQWFEYLK